MCGRAESDGYSAFIEVVPRNQSPVLSGYVKASSFSLETGYESTPDVEYQGKNAIKKLDFGPIGDQYCPVRG